MNQISNAPTRTDKAMAIYGDPQAVFELSMVDAHTLFIAEYEDHVDGPNHSGPAVGWITVQMDIFAALADPENRRVEVTADDHNGLVVTIRGEETTVQYSTSVSW